MFRGALILTVAFLSAGLFVYGLPSSHWGTSVPFGLGDELLGLWIYDRFSANLFFHSAPLLDGRIYFPEKDTLVFSEAMPLLGIYYRFLLFFLREKVLTYHLTNLSILFANAVAFYWVAKKFASHIAAILGALIFGYSSIRLAQLNHVQLFPQFFFPLAAYFLYRFERTHFYRYAGLVGLCLGFQFLASIHFGAMLLLALLPYAGLRLFSRKDLRSFWRGSALAIGICALIAGPLLLKYAAVSKRQGVVRSLGESTQFSASPANYLSAPPGNLLYQATKLFRGTHPHEKYLFFGIAALALLALGIARRPLAGPSRFWWKLGAFELVFSVWLSLGPNGGLYAVLYYLYPLLQALRTPGRFGFLFLFVAAAFAVRGADYLFERFPRPLQRVSFLAAFLLVFALENHRSFAWFEIPKSLDSATRFLSTLPEKSAVAHLPIKLAYQHPYESDAISLPSRECVRMYQSLFHGHAIFNGYSGFEPLPYKKAGGEELSGKSGELISTLKENGVSYVVFEKNTLEPARSVWLKNLGKYPVLFEDDKVLVTRIP